MPATTPAIPAGAELGRSYEKGIDVQSGSDWLIFRRISDLNVTPTPITQSAQTYDDFGAPNDDKTSESWTGAFSVVVNRLPNGYYLPEAERLKALSEPDAIGNQAVGTFRWYDKPYQGTPHPEDAYEGEATVAITRNNVAADGSTETWGITLTGKGKRRKIANPFQGWNVADDPAIAAVTPAGAGTDDLITIQGNNFLGATAVTVGGDPLTGFTVVSAGTIVGVLPADTAGSAPVIVTTPNGVSPAFPYTRTA